jgi:hypothetical protein
MPSSDRETATAAGLGARYGLLMVFVMVRGRGRIIAAPAGTGRLGLAPAERRLR